MYRWMWYGEMTTLTIRPQNTYFQHENQFLFLFTMHNTVSLSLHSNSYTHTHARTHQTKWNISQVDFFLQLHTNENNKNIFSNWEIQLNCRRSEFSFEFLSTRFATKLNMNDKIFFIYIAKQQHTQRQQQQQQQTAVALFLVFSDVRNVSKWKNFMNLFL